jgi:hypothetical protein
MDMRGASSSFADILKKLLHRQALADRGVHAAYSV